MKSQNPEFLSVNVWLHSEGNYAQSTLFCFKDRLLLEKRTNVMINSTRHGPIGVKDVIDALRLAPDEEKKEVNGRDKIAATIAVAAGEMIQVLWVPEQDFYEFHLTPRAKVNCNAEMKSPPAWNKPFLTLRGIEQCSPVTIQRMGADPKGNQETVQITVAEACNGID